MYAVIFVKPFNLIEKHFKIWRGPCLSIFYSDSEADKLKCRGVSGYLKLSGQVLIRRAQNYSAKIWVDNCPPASYAPVVNWVQSAFLLLKVFDSILHFERISENKIGAYVRAGLDFGFQYTLIKETTGQKNLG